MGSLLYLASSPTKSIYLFCHQRTICSIMWRRHRLSDPEDFVDEHRRSARRNDNAPPKSPRGRHRRSSLRPVNFSETLAAAALKKHKVAPLFLDEDGTKVIRLRALQHMVVCNLRRGLAGEVKTICNNKSAPQSENDEKLRSASNLHASVSHFCDQIS